MIVYVIWNMFISKLESLESRGNQLLTSKCRFKTAKIHELCYVLEFKTRRVPVAFLFCLVLADLDKKYTNEIEMNKK